MVLLCVYYYYYYYYLLVHYRKKLINAPGAHTTKDLNWRYYYY